MDSNLILTIVPTALSAGFAFLIAKRRNLVSERINKAKIDSEIQSQALKLVETVVNDMRTDFRNEINTLREENRNFKIEIESNSDRINSLQDQLTVSDDIIQTLKSEINTLRSTLKLYEAENARLKSKGE